jgi:hypothetical protein
MKIVETKGRLDAQPVSEILGVGKRGGQPDKPGNREWKR